MGAYSQFHVSAGDMGILEIMWGVAGRWCFLLGTLYRPIWAEGFFISGKSSTESYNRPADVAEHRDSQKDTITTSLIYSKKLK